MDPLLVRSLAGLHLGEAEAIAVAVRGAAELLLMDERLGRRAPDNPHARMIGNERAATQS